MSDPGREPPPPPSAGQMPALVPSDSGTEPGQQEAGDELSGELVPKSQLSQVADCVNKEASGLLSVDPASLQSLGALRLFASYANEQAENVAALRRERAEALDRERAATTDASSLRTRLAVAKNINDTEQKLRTPRTLFSVLGLAVAGFGVDQFGGTNIGLGIALIVIGLVIVAATNLIAPSGGGKS